MDVRKKGSKTGTLLGIQSTVMRRGRKEARIRNGSLDLFMVFAVTEPSLVSAPSGPAAFCKAHTFSTD